MTRLEVLWKRLTADWRNVALLIAGLALLYFIIPSMSGGHRRNTTPLIKIGKQTITEQEVIDGLKARAGDALLTDLITSTLFENYAAQQGVYVYDQEVDQYIAFEQLFSKLNGSSLEQSLQAQKISMIDHRRVIKEQLLQMKLVVPTEAIEAAVAQAAKAGTPPLTLPAYFVVRELAFPSKSDADKAIELLNSGKQASIDAALNMALNGTSMREPGYFIPSMADKKMAASFLRDIKDIQPGQCSKPIPIKVPNAKNVHRVIQLVEAHETEKPTMTNRGLIVGIMLMGQDDYQIKLKEVTATALKKVEIYAFGPFAEYKGASEFVKNLRLNNPDIPSAGAEEGAGEPNLTPIATPSGASATNAKPTTPKANAEGK